MMNFRLRWLAHAPGIITLTMTALALPAPSKAAQNEPLQAGVAVTDITPPAGYRMSGYFSERSATGTHDPLQAKALYLCQGNTQAVLVFCDLIGIFPEVSRPVRREAARRLETQPGSVLLAATHSHTGPLYAGALRKHFHEAAIEKYGRDPREEIDYAEKLRQSLLEVIDSARTAARPVNLKAGTALQEGISFNRRFVMRDGTVRFNPGRMNPDIVRPCGPIDPQLSVVCFTESDAENPLAVLSVFALHLDTVGGTEYSADYPLYLEKKLRAQLGPEVTSLFGAGTCGDINHIDVTAESRLSGQDLARHLGETLAESVLEHWPKLKAIESPALAVRAATVDVALQQFSPDEVEQARQDMYKIGTRELSFLEQVQAYKIMAIELRKGETIPLDVQVFRLSRDLAIVGLPGEVFVELGLAIKEASPFSSTIVIELCNDAPGYIPTHKAFAEGSYETVNSRVESGSGETLVETAVQLLEELHE